MKGTLKEKLVTTASHSSSSSSSSSESYSHTSCSLYVHHDNKEEESISELHDASHANVSPLHDSNEDQKSDNGNASNVNADSILLDKQWFCVDDKLDVCHNRDWHRATIKDVDCYAILVEYGVESEVHSKWIKDCHHIFKSVCHCSKKCRNEQHTVAAYGGQSNYVYDEQIEVCNLHCINFHYVMYQLLSKYISYNSRDACVSIDNFNDDYHALQQNVSQCATMSTLLSVYQNNLSRLQGAFDRANMVQQEMCSNIITIGEYLGHLQTNNQAKFKNAIKSSYDAIKQIDDTLQHHEEQIKNLLEQQTIFKQRKQKVFGLIQNMKDTKKAHNLHLDRLQCRHQECMQNVTKSTNVLSRNLKEHKHDLCQLQELKLAELEESFKVWDKQDTISWIMMIDDKRFSSSHKYSKFRKMLNRSQINGQTLNDLKSDLFLKYVGLGIESRTALVNEINRVVQQHGYSGDTDSVGSAKHENSLIIPEDEPIPDDYVE